MTFHGVGMFFFPELHIFYQIKHHISLSLVEKGIFNLIFFFYYSSL